MEYEIFKKVENIPYFIRLIFGIACILFGIISAIIPLLPGAIFGFILGGILIIPAHKIKKLIKIRKGLYHLFGNFSMERLKHKWNDIKKHIHHIIFHD